MTSSRNATPDLLIVLKERLRGDLASRSFAFYAVWSRIGAGCTQVSRFRLTSRSRPATIGGHSRGLLEEGTRRSTTAEVVDDTLGHAGRPLPRPSGVNCELMASWPAVFSNLESTTAVLQHPPLYQRPAFRRAVVLGIEYLVPSTRYRGRQPVASTARLSVGRSTCTEYQVLGTDLTGAPRRLGAVHSPQIPYRPETVGAVRHKS